MPTYRLLNIEIITLRCASGLVQLTQINLQIRLPETVSVLVRLDGSPIQETAHAFAAADNSVYSQTTQPIAVKQLARLSPTYTLIT